MSTPARRSRKQEERGAAALEGTRTPGSGAGTVKNDVRSLADGRAYPESAELKTTGDLQFRLKLDDLVKAGRIALSDGRMMLFGVEFTGPRGPWRYVVLEESDYLELIAAARGA